MNSPGEAESLRARLRHVVDEYRRRRIAEAIVAGYRAQPQTPAEVGWPDEATVAMIAEESW